MSKPSYHLQINSSWMGTNSMLPIHFLFAGRIIWAILFTVLTFTISGCGRADSTSERKEVAAEQVTSEPANSDSQQAGDSQLKLPAQTKERLPQSDQSLTAPAVGDSQPNKDDVGGSAAGGRVGGQETSSTGYRLPKLRMAPADSVLAQHGLRKVESRRLILITDSDDRALDQLPGLANQLFEALQEWFGELPPAADGSDFQVLGHVMIDRDKFRSAGLLPDESFTIRHGRHRRYAFWAGYPDTDYYRRHLALHEFVHCYMTCENRVFDVPPPWYLEGMAELFGTHRIEPPPSDGFTSAARPTADQAAAVQATFGVMPESAAGFEGWGRIRAIREGFSDGDHDQLSELQIPTFEQVVPQVVAVFESPFQYSSSWAVCWFLKHHPDAAAVMPALAKQRTYPGFLAEWERQQNDMGNRLAVDWLLFCEQLDFGFDADRCFPKHSETTPSPSQVKDGSATVRITAQQGWQDSTVVVRSGATIDFRCDGRCVMNETTKPWESTPNGLSIEYYRGNRLGQVVAVLVSSNGKKITDRIPIGASAKFTANFDGRIWLQVNDAVSTRTSNSGKYEVQLEWSE
ncbi:MAG: hypothetical protein ABJZ55_08040 [Fuerstiella sp.]